MPLKIKEEPCHYMLDNTYEHKEIKTEVKLEKSSSDWYLIIFLNHNLSLPFGDDNLFKI